MPDALHLKPDCLDTPEKRAQFTIAVVGCGSKGLKHGLAFADAGFKVTCADSDQSKISRLSKRKNPLLENKGVKVPVKNKPGFTADIKSAVANNDIIILTVDAKLDQKNNADYSEIQAACKSIGLELGSNKLVVYLGVVGLGITQQVVKETLENSSGLKVGTDFGFALVPIQEGNAQVDNRQIVISAGDEISLNATATLYGVLAKKGVTAVSDFKIAEAAALFGAVKTDVICALANELAVFSERAGLDYSKACRLVESFVSESSQPILDQENSRKEAYVLLDNAESLNAKLRLVAIARQVNENMARHAVGLVQEALRGCGKTLRRARITVLGVGKLDTIKFSLIDSLIAKGAKVCIFISGSQETGQIPTGCPNKRTVNEAVEGVDCIVLLGEDEEIKKLNLQKVKTVMRMPAAIVDLIGSLDPFIVENEGFIYRGLGKGAWKK